MKAITVSLDWSSTPDARKVVVAFLESIMEEISSTPISTPTATVDSSIGTTNSPSPTPVPQSLPPLPPLPEDDDGTSKRKNSSIVWQHFEKMKNPDGSWVKPARSKCKYCPQTYASCSRSNGTSAMRTHVMFQCRKSPIYVPNKKQKFLTFDSAESGGKLISVAYDKTTSKLACAKMVVRDELPFSFVENEGFKEFMKVTQPLFKSPSRRTIARDILKLYEAERERIRGWISVNQQRLSLTTDTWTSIQNINYMVLTGHFIDASWKLHKRILNFCVIPNHKGKTIGKLVETCLIKWGIDKVFTIVVDNASPNQVALDYMKEKIGNWNQLVLGGSFLHLRCCCHILNLIVRDGMDELDFSIDGIRNCVKYIRLSPARLEKFRKCAAEEKIEHKGGIVPLDVCTRWNSTYFMLDLACKYKKAFLRLEDEDQQFENYFQEKVGGNKRHGPPRMADWEKAARLVKFLKIFYEATLKFSATKHVTSNEPLLWMCTIVGELDKCMASDDHLLVCIGTSMKKKFDKYWLQLQDLNQILLIAVILDPRYKLLYLEFFFPKLQANLGEEGVQVMIDEVKKTLSSLFDFYADKDPAAAAASRSVTMPRIDCKEELSEEDSHAANLHQFKLLRQEKDVVVIKNELDKYLMEASEEPSNPKFEILAWWKENAPRYPILSQIAKDVFAVPASTVASESAFSLGKRVVDPFRASLTPSMVEGLVCLSDWLRGAGFDAYKEPTKDELQLYEELEKLEIDRGSGVLSDSEE
ncbi:uncharacterized protein LOC112187027 [Rosa chinensis]|uniref:uncharacterized protein LOC112187027 n=1 Tax=Rosa chinensis TaxID=74649 RepID=UPI001AD8F7E4|nr:uncharacterized protein LOC112187027 [Rosa chinensis]